MTDLMRLLNQDMFKISTDGSLPEADSDRMAALQEKLDDTLSGFADGQVSRADALKALRAIRAEVKKKANWSKGDIDVEDNREFILDELDKIIDYASPKKPAKAPAAEVAESTQITETTPEPEKFGEPNAERAARLNDRADELDAAGETIRAGVFRLRGLRDGQGVRLYTATSGGSVSLPVVGEVETVAKFQPSQQAREIMEEVGISPLTFHELTPGAESAAAFYDAIEAAKSVNPHGASVYVYSPEEYENMRLFISDDGAVGFALKGSDLVSVFKGNTDSKRVAHSMVPLAIEEGALTGDAFDTTLPKIYGDHGLKTVARLRWDDSQAPDDWNKETFSESNNGEPDVVFMAYDPDSLGYAPGQGEYAPSYDDAVAAQQAALGIQPAPGEPVEVPAPFEFVVPEGAHVLDLEGFEPEGRVDQDSPDYTDDPTELAQRFTSKELGKALQNALTPSAGGVATGSGNLEFEEGAEPVPAEALYKALQKKNAKVQSFVSKVYDKVAGNSANVDALAKYEADIAAASAALTETKPTPAEAISSTDLTEADVKKIMAGEGITENDEFPGQAPDAVLPKSQQVAEQVVETVETTQTPPPPQGSTPRRIITKVKDLEPGDVLVKDQFVVEQVFADADSEAKRKGSVWVVGHYAGHQSQKTKLWSPDDPREVFRDVEAPAAGDLPPLSKPFMANFGKTYPKNGEWFFVSPKDEEKYNAARAKYDDALEASKALWTPPETADVIDLTAPQVAVVSGNVFAKDLQPGDIAYSKETPSAKYGMDPFTSYFIIEEVFTDEETLPGKVSVRGHFPGHASQVKQWNEGTPISVIRGAAAPAAGDGPELHRPSAKDEKYAGGDEGKALYEADVKKYYEQKSASSVPFIDADSEFSLSAYGESLEVNAPEKPSKPSTPKGPAFQGERLKELLAMANGDPAVLKSLIDEQEVVYYDIETTGNTFDPDARPIQIAAYKIKNGEVVDSFVSFMDPGEALGKYYYEIDDAGNKTIKTEIRTPDGDLISDEFFATQEPVEDVMGRFFDWIGVNPIVIGHNLSGFDNPVLSYIADTIGADYVPDTVDTFSLANKFIPFGQRNLGSLAQRYGVELDNWHDARSDALASKGVFYGLLDEMAKEQVGLDALDYDGEISKYESALDKYKAARDKYDADMAAYHDALIGTILKKPETPVPSMDQLINDVKVVDTVDPEGIFNNSSEANNPPADFPGAVADPNNSVAWVTDDANTTVIDGKIRPIDMKVGDFVKSKYGPFYKEILSIEQDPEKPSNFIVTTRSIPDGAVTSSSWFKYNAGYEGVRRPNDSVEVEPIVEPDNAVMSGDEFVEINDQADAEKGLTSSIDISNWTKIAGPSGSNAGGVFEDTEGNRYYVKFPQSEEHARAEALASALYVEAGIPVARVLLGKDANGDTVVVSPWVDDSEKTFSERFSEPTVKDAVQAAFAVDAWLMNWDVIGLGYDNIVLVGNDPFRVDPGGALQFRAQGARKDPKFLVPEVTEVDTMRTMGTAKNIFGSMSDADIAESVKLVSAISPERIDDLVAKAYPNDPETAESLSGLLKARREDLISRFAAPEVAPVPSEAPEAVTEESVPEAPETPEAEDSLGQIIAEVEQKTAKEESDAEAAVEALPDDEQKTLAFVEDIASDINSGAIESMPDADPLIAEVNQAKVVDSSLKDPSLIVSELRSLFPDNYVLDNGHLVIKRRVVVYDGVEYVYETVVARHADESYSAYAVETNTATGAKRYTATSGKFRPQSKFALLNQIDKVDDRVSGADPRETLNKTSKKNVKSSLSKFKIFSEDTINIDSVAQKLAVTEDYTPHISADGITPLKPGDRVVYTKTGDTGTVTKLKIKQVTNANGTYEFLDYVYIKFDGPKGFTSISGKFLEIISSSKTAPSPAPVLKSATPPEDKKDDPKPESFLENSVDLGPSEIPQYSSDSEFLVGSQKKTATSFLDQFGTDNYNQFKDAIKNAGLVVKDSGGASSGKYLVPGIVVTDNATGSMGIVTRVSPEKSSVEVAWSTQSLAGTATEAPSSSVQSQGSFFTSDAAKIKLNVDLDNSYFEKVSAKVAENKAAAAKAAAAAKQAAADAAAQAAADAEQKMAAAGLVSGSGSEPVIVDGPYDWNSSNFEGVLSVGEALDKVKDSATDGREGFETLVDSDSIEDSKIKIQSVTSTDDEKRTRVTFKLTEWAAKNIISDLDDRFLSGAPGIQEIDKMSITRYVINEDGELVDSGKAFGKSPVDGDSSETIIKFADKGRTFRVSLTNNQGDPIGFALIHRANKDLSTPNFSSNTFSTTPITFHNTVELLLNDDVSPQDVADALSKVGVSQARPATPEDIKILAENKIISLFSAKNGTGTTNLTGASRTKVLEDIATKYGVTADGVEVESFGNGRQVNLLLSKEVGKKLAKMTNVAYFHHRPYGGLVPAKIVNMIADDGSLKSTYDRWMNGINVSGNSSDTDVNLAGGGSVFLSVGTKGGPSSAEGFYFSPAEIFRRLDYYATEVDRYGTKSEGVNFFDMFASNSHYGGWELMIKSNVPLSFLSKIRGPQDSRDKIASMLEAKGITEINGVPVKKILGMVA